MMMAHVFGVQNITTTKLRRSRKQRGYMLITLTLAVALITIGLLAVLPDIVQQIRRDREEELRHRGTEYMRAIQRYYRKFGRYPTRLEDLENTNNIRFLRKRYKDPMSRDPQTGKDRDFKILHPQDVLLNSGSGPGQATGQIGLAGQVGLGGLTAGAGGPGVQTLGGLQTPQSGLQNGNNSGGSSDNSNPSNTANAQGSNTGSSGGGPGLSGQVFGGGPIIGVASTSKEKTIREFNSKSHYNDWYFAFDASQVAVGLVVGPWRPNTGFVMGGFSNFGQPDAGPGQGVSQPATGQSQNGPGVALPGSASQPNPNGNPPNN
jgi:type II secretory pathway pseudopilin PulG